MAEVTGFTAARMLEIEKNSIVSGTVAATGHLILKTKDGRDVNAGIVKGQDGKDATALLGVQDTQSVNLTLTGAGTVAKPWQLAADLTTLPDGMLTTGILESEYRGGPAKVKINGVWSTEAYRWLGNYDPHGQRLVNLIKTGATWSILNQNTDMVRVLDTDRTTWISYNERENVGDFRDFLTAVRLPSGLIQLGGLVVGIKDTASNALVATLPEGFRPDNDMIFPIQLGAVPGAITIGKDGTIRLRNAMVGATFITLDGVAFYAAGVAQWTAIGTGGSSFAASFESNPTWNAQFGLPSYWLDPYGFVWFNGLIRPKTTITADNTPMFTMPGTHVAHSEHHIRTASNDGHAHVGTIGSDITWKIGSFGGAGSWTSLHGVFYTTAAGRSANPWTYPTRFPNGHTNYAAKMTQIGYLLREDGMRTAGGFLRQGTQTSVLLYLKDPELQIARNKKIIIPTAADSSHRRLDIHNGMMVPQNGAPGIWYSLDSIAWSTV